MGRGLSLQGPLGDLEGLPPGDAQQRPESPGDWGCGGILPVGLAVAARLASLFPGSPLQSSYYCSIHFFST